MYTLLLFAALTGPVEQKWKDFEATIIATIDGDSVGIEFPRADKDWTDLFRQRSVRIMARIDEKGNGVGIDTPEMKDRRPDIRARAIAAKIRMAQLCPVNSKCVIRIVDVSNPDDKYGGRIDALLFVNGVNVGAQMVHEGHAKEWNGKGSAPWANPGRAPYRQSNRGNR